MAAINLKVAPNWNPIIPPLITPANWAKHQYSLPKITTMEQAERLRKSILETQLNVKMGETATTATAAFAAQPIKMETGIELKGSESQEWYKLLSKVRYWERAYSLTAYPNGSDTLRSEYYTEDKQFLALLHRQTYLQWSSSFLFLINFIYTSFLNPAAPPKPPKNATKAIRRTTQQYYDEIVVPEHLYTVQAIKTLEDCLNAFERQSFTEVEQKKLGWYTQFDAYPPLMGKFVPQKGDSIEDRGWEPIHDTPILIYRMGVLDPTFTPEDLRYGGRWGSDLNNRISWILWAINRKNNGDTSNMLKQQFMIELETCFYQGFIAKLPSDVRQKLFARLTADWQTKSAQVAAAQTAAAAAASSSASSSSASSSAGPTAMVAGRYHSSFYRPPLLASLPPHSYRPRLRLVCQRMF